MTPIVERDITYYLQQRNTEKTACPETLITNITIWILSDSLVRNKKHLSTEWCRIYFTSFITTAIMYGTNANTECTVPPEAFNQTSNQCHEVAICANHFHLLTLIDKCNNNRTRETLLNHVFNVNKKILISSKKWKHKSPFKCIRNCTVNIKQI